MDVQLITVPYDSGQKMVRMGCGPARFAETANEVLRGVGIPVAIETVEVSDAFPTEVGTTFKLHREVSQRVSEARKNERFPMVVAGNCGLASIGTVAAFSDRRTGVIWFDAHGDYNTPDTSPSGFLDGMSLAVITGRGWKGLAASVPGFRMLDENQVMLAGARDLDPKEQEAVQSSSMCVLTPERIAKVGLVKALGPGLDYIGMNVERVYLHIDLDILDPKEAPANHFAVPGGIAVAELLAGIDAIAARIPIVAAGIASYDPDVDKEKKALNAGFEIMKKIGAVGKVMTG
jgi:arginase